MQLTIHMSNTERESTVLPHAYQHLIQGMLFNAWKEDPEFAAMLHAVNDDGGRIFRGFTFGTLQGRFLSQAKSVCYTTPISLTIRALNPLLIEKLIRGIRRQAHISLRSRFTTPVSFRTTGLTSGIITTESRSFSR